MYLPQLTVERRNEMVLIMMAASPTCRRRFLSPFHELTFSGCRLLERNKEHVINGGRRGTSLLEGSMGFPC